MASGHSGEKFKLKAIQSGADAYLAKPLAMKALKEILWFLISIILHHKLNLEKLKINFYKIWY